MFALGLFVLSLLYTVSMSQKTTIAWKTRKKNPHKYIHSVLLDGQTIDIKLLWKVKYVIKIKKAHQKSVGNYILVAVIGNGRLD